MTIARTLKCLLIAALVACASSYAAETPIQVAMEDGKTVARFTVARSHCILVDDQVRCSPAGK
jgi:hypothetical protein